MRKFLLAFAALLSITLGASAQTPSYCLPSAIGYASGVTGGAGKSVTLVTNQSQLATAVKNGNGIYIITQSFNVTSVIKGTGSNYTLLALPGVTLTGTLRDKAAGIFNFSGGSNIILRNLTLVGAGAYDCDASTGDDITLQGAKNVWIDHCDLSDGVDGNIDIKSSSDNITISWTKFHYDKAPKAGGSGGTDDHRFNGLIGSSSSDKPSDGTYNVSFIANWWADGCVERMPRARNCLVQCINDYWGSKDANYYIGPENGNFYCEGCYFDNRSSKIKTSTIVKSYGGTNKIQFKDCYSPVTLPNISTTVNASASLGSYEILSATAAKTAVTNTTCGAGATLEVDVATGMVSSPCNATEPTIALTSASATASQSLQEGNAMTNITYQYGGSANDFEITYKANGSTVSKPSWLTASKSGSVMTFSGTPTTIGSANTTYQILINSTDGSQDSEVLTASISVLPLTPGTLTLTSGSATQNVYTGQNLANIVYTYGGGATGATVSGLPSGVDYTVDAATGKVTISGTPSVAGTYNYTVTTTGGSGTATESGTITVSDPTTLATPAPTYTLSGTTANVTWPAVENASSYNIQVCSASGASGTTTGNWEASGMTIGGTTSGLTLTNDMTSKTKAITYPDGYSSSACINTGGNSSASSGMPTKRYMSFAVDGPVKITVWFATNSDGSARGAYISDGTNEIASKTSSASTTGEILEGNYTGAGGTIYVYADASLNFSKVAVEPAAASTCNTYSTTSTSYSVTGVSDPANTTISVQAVGDGVGYESSAYVEAQSAAVAVPANITLTSPSGDATLYAYQSLPTIRYTYTGTPTVTWTGTASASTPPAGVTVNNTAGVITLTGSPTTPGNYGYTINVAAINGGTPATATASGTLTVNSPVALAAPTASYTVSGTKANVTWSAIAGATGYIIKVCSNPSDESTCDETNVSSTTASVDYSEGDVVTIMAEGDGITTANSPWATATKTATPVPASVSMTSASGTNAQSITLGDAITNITYSFTGTAAVTWTGTASASTPPSGMNVTIGTNTITISGTPVDNGSYGYTITANAIAGGTPATATANGSLRVNAVVIPASCGGSIDLVLNISTPGTYDINIYNAGGTLVYKAAKNTVMTAGNNTIMINPGCLASGTYTYKVESGTTLIDGQTNTIVVP